MTDEKKAIDEKANETVAYQLVGKQTEQHKALDAIVAFWNEPDSVKAAAMVRQNARNIHDFMRNMELVTKAFADLKARADYAICALFEKSPELQQEFKIQQGARSTKCTDMRQLMDRYTAKGYDPAGLIAQCSAMTAKKAAEAFGLSEAALLEEAGDIFTTTENKPTVKMAY